MEQNNNPLSIIRSGVFTQNPIFVQVLGMCPALAVTTSLENAFGMGIATTLVLTGSNMVVSLVRRLIPDKIRIASYVVIISSFVTIIDMLLKVYFPSLSDALGIFIPLIVVNCLILARAELFASKNTVGRSALDGLGMGLGFTLALCILGAVRELLGNGTLLGFPLMGASFQPIIMMILPPGAFIALGLILGAINLIARRRRTND